MNFLERHIDTGGQLITGYAGNEPFHLYLKTYFKQNKKHGSRDRRNITEICYVVLRTGKSLLRLNFKDQFRTAYFLLNESPGAWTFLYSDKWLSDWPVQLQDRINRIQLQFDWFDIDAVFPDGVLSDLLVRKDEFIQAHFTQPDVFIRVRPGHELLVKNMLFGKSIVHSSVNQHCIALKPGVELEEADGVNKDFIIQDYSSQQTGVFISHLIKHFTKPSIEVWDCCAASGGKSIMAYDILQKTDLTVSDIRTNILHNLKLRFQQAGIKNYKIFSADLSKPLKKEKLSHQQFDLIICDVPCTGSGTWGRTPEQLRFFDTGSIEKYAALQQSIVSNVLPFLAADGYLLYITCSVFKQENEELVIMLAKKHNLSIIEMECIAGATKRADTMFACLLQHSK